MDAAAETRASREVTIGPQRFTSFGFSGARLDGRVQLRPVVTQDAACDANLSVTLEIIDAEGHTKAAIGIPGR